MLRPALVRATFSRRRSWSRAFVLLLVALTLALPASAGAAIAPRSGALSNPEAAGRPLAAIGGRSAVAKHVEFADLVRHGEVAPLKGLAAPPPGRGAPTNAPSATQPRLPVSPTAATIPTTTTLQAAPNPLVYPAQVHLTATITPPPQPSDGFTPAVSFYVDGVLGGVAPINSTTGQGSDDMSLVPGTYEIIAQFGGIGLYDASSSSPVTVTVVQAPPLATETGAAALQSSAGFAGAAGTFTAPIANPSLGVGPRDIVQMSESGVRFYERSGSPLFHMSLPDFFTFEPDGQASAPRSPRVLFDALRDRWIAIEVTRDSSSGHLYIAASDTDSFVDDWWIYVFDFDNEAPTNPALGVSGDKIAVGYDAQTISTGLSAGSTVFVVSYTNLLAHVATLPYTRTVLSTTYQAWRPAQNLSTGNVVQAVGWAPASHHITYLTATGTVTGPGTGVTFSNADLTSGPTALPGTGSSGLMLGPTNALWNAGHLWFVSTHDCVPTGDIDSEPCVRVTELATASLTLEQDFAIGRNGYASYLGGIGIAGDGSLVVVYSQTTTGPDPAPRPISTYATIQVPGAPANSVRPSQLISAGVRFCPGGPTCGASGGGSAAYLAVAADPSDSHAVWQGAVNSVSGGWATWISQLTGATTPPAGSFTLAGGRTVTNSLRLGITPQPTATAIATQMLISNSPTTAAGKLSVAKQLPIGARIPWSLADASTGGSTATGSRTVYVQFGNGIDAWSTVQSRAITIGTPLGADFVPLNPARLLDSRTGNGLSGPFRHRVPRSFQVTGRGGVPMNAVAVTGNLTVTRQTSGGYVFLGPTATSTPTSSTLNFPLADIRANGVTVKLSDTGKLGAVFVGSSSARTTDLVFDVTGYMLADDPNAPQGGTFVPITPTRFLDTRVPLGLAGRFPSRVPRTFCITGCGPVPDDATAVTGNLTVTGQTSAGYLFLGPTPTSTPTSSTLNFPKGDIRANNVTVRLDADGNLSAVFVGATSAASTNVVFDVTGYFVRGPWGATFIPLAPARILDTRTGVGLSGPFSNHVPRAFATAGKGDVPATGSVGVTGNLTVVGQTAGGFAFLGPTAVGNPTSSTLNIPVGDIRANGLDVGLAVAGTLSGVWVSPVASTTALIFDVGGYFR